MKTIPIDRAELVRRMNACFGVVKYRLGSKPNLYHLPPAFKTSDCSGFVRWLLFQASHETVKIAPGSWYQQEWCKAQGFKKVVYKDVAGLMDSRLRIAFIDGVGSKVGHVWLVCNSMTIECYGGHGCGRRAWDTPVLLNNVDATYVLTDKI
ncbi:MAG: hypothetical protein WC455_12010 [Dehalococcoidia bacterium]|jgi:hypothetical protein